MVWTDRVIVVAVAVKSTAERGAVESAHPSQANVKRVGNGPLSGAAGRRARAEAGFFRRRNRGHEGLCPGLDGFRVHSDRVGNHGQPGCLVLQHLQTALALAPWILGQPANSDLAGRQIASLPRLRPRNGDDAKRLEPGKLVTDHTHPEAGDLPAQPIPERLLLL